MQAKDFSELYNADKDALDSLLADIVSAARTAAVAEALAVHDEALAAKGLTDSSKAASDILGLNGLSDPVPTGFATLDEQLDGGLMPGVTVLGAASSVGKTMLLLCIAINAIESGYHCLFYSLEMGAKELVARMLSRLIYRDSGLVVSSNRLMIPRKRRSFSFNEFEAMHDACGRFTDTIASSLLIMQPEGQPTAADVSASIAHAKERAELSGGKGLIAFVDYLQLCGAEKEFAFERQVIDANILGLRQAARAHGIPIVAISSLNRASYFGEVAMDSFKESGSIEYGADRLIGLQPLSFEDEISNLKAARKMSDEKAARHAMDDSKRSPVRSVELKLLKNRNGALPASPVEFDFIGPACTFVDTAADPVGHRAALAILDSYEAEYAQDDDGQAYVSGEDASSPNPPHKDDLWPPEPE